LLQQTVLAHSPTMESHMNYITRDKLIRQLGVSRHTLTRWERENEFPAPIRATDRVVLYDTDKVDNWLQRRAVNS
jgi:predicted DNA-binding transcriptional regulator AlpA